LISNWLPKNIAGYELKFEVFIPSYENFAIQLVKFDDEMKMTKLSELIIGNKKIYPNVSHYQLEKYFLIISF
jgi:hypothetical protein